MTARSPLVLAALITVLLTMISEAATPVPQSRPRLKPQHPRLLIDQAGFEDLQQRIKSDPVLRRWDKGLREQAERIVKAPLPVYDLERGIITGGNPLTRMRDIYVLAFIYRMHGEQRYLDRLWRQLETLAGFPSLSPREGLEVGAAEEIQGFAIAYDWLYDLWTDSQRIAIRQAIIRHGLNRGQEDYSKGGWWVRADVNQNPTCNCAMVMAALAIGDEEPRLANSILQGALASIPFGMGGFAPDGGGREGSGYWYGGTHNAVVMLAALESALGSDYGLSKSSGLDKTGLFPLYMTGPTGGLFNYGDGTDREGRTIRGPDFLLWLGHRFDLPACTWFATSTSTPSQSEPGPLAMIWWPGSGKDPEASGLPLDAYFRRVEVATLRSRWNDPQAMFVGIQAGTNQRQHAHLDLGSFVLDGLGQRWALDLGAETSTYEMPRVKGGRDRRWDYYRCRAEGHNTLVINPDQGPDQDPKANARISRFVSGPENAIVVADLTPAYAAHARRVERGIAMLDRCEVLVQDEMQAFKPADVWWFMHTLAEVSLSEDRRSATMKLGEVALTASLLAPSQARFEVRPAEPFRTSLRDEQQSRNKDVRKLTVHLTGISQLQLAILFSPSDGQSGTKPPKIRPLAGWKVATGGSQGPRPPTKGSKATTEAKPSPQKGTS